MIYYSIKFTMYFSIEFDVIGFFCFFKPFCLFNINHVVFCLFDSLRYVLYCHLSLILLFLFLKMLNLKWVRFFKMVYFTLSNNLSKF